MFFFASLTKSLRPVIVIPPMMGSVLYGNIKDLKTHWYCKSNHENSWLWVTDKYLVPPLTNCLAQYLTCAINQTTNKPDSRPEAEIYTIDFGGDSAMTYLDPGLLKHHFIPLMHNALNYFYNNGYTIKQNIFGAPYDWRLNPVSLDQYWIDLQNLIEQAYSQNDNQAVALWGFSAGNYVIHELLTKKVTPEWCSKYVDRAIMLAPAFPGSMEALQCIYFGKIVFLPNVFSTTDIDNMVLSIPTVYGHLPNVPIFGDRPVILGPDGKKYTANDFYDLAISQGKIPDEYIPIFKANLPFINHDITDINVDTYFIFNTALDTPAYIDFSNGWDKNHTVVNGKGDTTINDFGLYYGCKNWKSQHVRVCHDVNTTEKGYDHVGMVLQQDVIELIYKACMSDDWKNNKVEKISHIIIGNGYSDWNQLSKD